MVSTAASPAVPGRPAAVLVRLGPNGPVVAEPRAPLLRADDLGVLRGDGVFERFLVNGGQPRHLEEHLARLARSAAMTELEIPGPGTWRVAVSTAIGAWSGSNDCEMRLVCTRGPEEGGPPSAYVLGQELRAGLLRQRRDGIAVVTISRGLPSGIVGDAPWLLLGAKTLSYAVNLAAKRWAESMGADDAIFVGTDGTVWEAGTSAVVASYGRRLVSPSSALGILDSISVAHLFSAAAGAGWDVAREDLSVDGLRAADGVWLSSSLRFVRVHTLDGKGLPPAAAHDELAILAANS
jgi:4-amino-4-deoxychorismate lyase